MSFDTTITKSDFSLSGSLRTSSTGQRTIIQLGALGGGLVFLHYRTFHWLVMTWWTEDRYSYGFLIPLVAAYLVWIKREHLARIPCRPRPVSGGLLLLLSGILLLAGRAGGYVLVEGISLLILLPGIVLVTWGTAHLRVLLLPLAYLHFMVPWTEPFITQASQPAQLLSARLGSVFLRAVGLPVFREGTHLQISTVAIEVAQECSGLSLLYSIIALAIPVVYLTQRTWWRAATVVLLGVVITLLANGARVALVGSIAYYYGKPMLHGPLHVLQGWFVAQVGIIALFLANWSISKLPSSEAGKLYEQGERNNSDAGAKKNLTGSVAVFALLVMSLSAVGFYFHGWLVAIVAVFVLCLAYWVIVSPWRRSRDGVNSDAASLGKTAPAQMSRSSGSYVLPIIVLVGIGVYLQLFASPRVIHPNQDLSSVPYTVGTWHGQDSTWMDGARLFPGATAEVARSYRAPNGRDILLYVGYFASQGQGRSLVSPHSTLLRRHAREVDVPTPADESTRANHGELMLDGKRYETLFWYDLPSGNTTGRYETKWRQLWDAVLRGANNGAVVLLATQAPTDQNERVAVHDLRAFAAVLRPVLEAYLP
jgi:EpsI family protein